MSKPLWILVAALGLAAMPAAAQDAATEPLPTVDQVLARFVDAVGGRDALAAQGARHYSGTIVQDLTWTDPQHQETPFVADADSAGAVRWAESRAWSDLAAVAAEQPQDKIRWLLHPQNALRVEEFFPELSVTGREVRDGRTVVVLAPRALDYAYNALYFDEETGLLSHVGYHNDLQDLQPRDGVLFPQRWVFGRKGGHTIYVFDVVAAGPAPGRR